MLCSSRPLQVVFTSKGIVHVSRPLEAVAGCFDAVVNECEDLLQEQALSSVRLVREIVNFMCVDEIDGTIAQCFVSLISTIHRQLLSQQSWLFHANGDTSGTVFCH